MVIVYAKYIGVKGVVCNSLYATPPVVCKIYDFLASCNIKLPYM